MVNFTKIFSILGCTTFIALINTGSVLAQPTVNGNTINLPDDGWYQVQTSDGLTSLCNGESLCVVEPGEYIVINHSNGQRFENVSVGNISTAPSETTQNETPISPTATTTTTDFSISANQINFLTNDWYQVQTENGLTTLCNGEQTCVVQPGTYLIINHSSGQRFVNVSVGAANAAGPVAVESNPFVNEGFSIGENSITFLIDDWFEVQTSDGLFSICTGRAPCDLNPGSYIVINHTNRERYNIDVDGNSAVEGNTQALSPDEVADTVSIVGNKILFLDDDAYQVQTSDGQSIVCNAVPSCTVEPGTYLFINLTTPEQFTVAISNQNVDQQLTIDDAVLVTEIAHASDFLSDPQRVLRLSQFDNSGAAPQPPGPQSVLPISGSFNNFIPEGRVTLTNGTEITFNRTRDCTTRGRQYVREFAATVFSPKRTTIYFDKCQFNNYWVNGTARFNGSLGTLEAEAIYNLSIRNGQTVINIENGFLSARPTDQDRQFNASRYEVIKPSSNVTAVSLISTFTQTNSPTNSTALRSIYRLSNLNSQQVAYSAFTTDDLMLNDNGLTVVSGLLAIGNDAGELLIESDSGNPDLYLVTLNRNNESTVSELRPWSGIRLTNISDLDDFGAN